jgi:hypothetical protein
MDIGFRMLEICFWMVKIIKYCFDIVERIVEFWQNLIETASREF